MGNLPGAGRARRAGHILIRVLGSVLEIAGGFAIALLIVGGLQMVPPTVYMAVSWLVVLGLLLHYSHAGYRLLRAQLSRRAR